jgi:subtilisin family serine protease
MRLLSRATLRCLPFLLVALLVPSVAAAARSDERIPGQYIVVYERSVDDVRGATQRRESAQGFRAQRRYSRALKGFSARLSDRQVGRLRADAAVAAVVPDRVVRAAGDVPLRSGESTPPTGVRRIGAASATTAREASAATVAVLDSGIDLDHPDLRVTGGTNCVTPGASPDDDQGHGTHVAGTIAAKNDGAGVVGVAPGTPLAAVKVLRADGSGSTSSVVCGIDWALANGIDVLNMSLGGMAAPVRSCAQTNDPMHLAVCRAEAGGVTIVASAGNAARYFDDANQPEAPAAYPQVLTVTAMSDSDGRAGAAGGAWPCNTNEADDRAAGYSNFALTTAGAAHTMAAPGTCILSTCAAVATASARGPAWPPRTSRDWWRCACPRAGGPGRARGSRPPRSSSACAARPPRAPRPTAATASPATLRARSRTGSTGISRGSRRWTSLRRR